LNELQVAFSRENPKQKVYVQQKLMERKKLLWSLISEEKAYVYVCGNASGMAKDVYQTWVKIVEEESFVSQTIAANYVASLETSKHYLEDIWG